MRSHLLSSESLVPHVLQLVDVPGSNTSALNTYLGHGEDGLRAGYSEHDAFVFPSERMARRFAIELLVEDGAAWLPVPAPKGAIPIGRDGTASCRRCGCTHVFACPSRCSWAEPDLCSACTKPEPLVAWSVYQRPTDYPNLYVARRTIGGTPTQDLLQHATLEGLRAQLPQGLTALPRQPGDPGAFLELWL